MHRMCARAAAGWTRRLTRRRRRRRLVRQRRRLLRPAGDRAFAFFGGATEATPMDGRLVDGAFPLLGAPALLPARRDKSAAQRHCGGPRGGGGAGQQRCVAGVGATARNMNKELPELFGMLKAAEIEIKKEHQVLMVNKTTSFKKQGKSKGKFKKGGKKAATPPMKPKNGPKPDAECYYCKEKGHWKRNCSKYLADLKSGLVKKKKEDNNDEDPATYEEAMMSPDSNKWQEAMKSEMGSMYDNKVWTLVDLPDSRKAVENKWIFKRKTDADVSWASSKQCTVAKSSTESEYIAASEASSEAVWMKRFIVELGVVPSALDPLIIYRDNMGAIANAQEPRSHKRLKHIKLRYHSIREYIEDGEPQDSINPKPQSKGIAEEYPRQLAPSVGTLSAQDRSSAVPVTSAAFLLESPAPSDPRDSIRCGSFEFVPHPEALHLIPAGSSGDMDTTFGGVHFIIDSGGFLRLPRTSASGPKTSVSEGVTPMTTLKIPSRNIQESNRGSFDVTAGRRKRRRDSHREEEERTAAHLHQFERGCDDTLSIKGYTRSPYLSATEQLEAPCYLHFYIDPKDGREKSSHLLTNCQHFLEIRQFCDDLRAEAMSRVRTMERRAGSYSYPPEPYVPEPYV
ncbi:hypothetical protein QYE76_054823 [Lolium multiflorum]|uniref:CCHC-type domain-containing protein n=1 Tax=Lolium multiflorum TaxID=4521 RepID=A0AAD8SZ20_LOLMU|nr:hypothetical protein QYE76_054823 [Lolium multiflorum]